MVISSNKHMANKMNAKKVVKMRKMKAKNPKMPITKIAKKFRVSQAYAYNIINGIYFKQVAMPGRSRRRS